MLVLAEAEEKIIESKSLTQLDSNYLCGYSAISVVDLRKLGHTGDACDDFGLRQRCLPVFGRF
jgi:hypothetical protein